MPPENLSKKPLDQLGNAVRLKRFTRITFQSFVFIYQILSFYWQICQSISLFKADFRAELRDGFIDLLT
jgi:hypothetical protein